MSDSDLTSSDEEPSTPRPQGGATSPHTQWDTSGTPAPGQGVTFGVSYPGTEPSFGTPGSGVTSGTPARSSPAVTHAQAGEVDKAFVTSLKGVYKMVEMLVSLIAFICSAVGRNNQKNNWTESNRPDLDALRGGAAWCMFVAMLGFLIFAMTFFLWLFQVVSSLTPKLPVQFIEFIMLGVFCGLYLIAGIVAASFAKYSAGLAAATFFIFVMVVVSAIDGYLQYREWSVSAEGPYTCCGYPPRGGATNLQQQQQQQQQQQRPPAGPGLDAIQA